MVHHNTIIGTKLAFVLALSLGQLMSTLGRSTQECSTLYLLNVEPYPDDNKSAGWDEGLNLIPAGHLAAEQINNSSDILRGYNLKVLDIDSEACGRSTITKGLVNVYRQLVDSAVDNNSTSCIVGIIGLFCSSVTHALAPLLGHPAIGYVQLAGSTSPNLIHRNDAAFSNLFHMIESSSALNKAGIAMLVAFSWQVIGIIHDSGFYFLTAATDLVNRITALPNLEATAHVPIQAELQSITEAFNIINEQAIRINYWIAFKDEIAFLLCEAYKRQFVWPGHVYIISGPNSIDEILNISTSCTRKELMTVMEGVFVLHNRLYTDNRTTLISGLTYSEFREEYSARLRKGAKYRTDIVEENVYANSLYDQVWAFALTINNSLTSIVSQNLSFSDYRVGRVSTKALSSILKVELNKLSFQGASGMIEFNENREVPTSIDIFQIQNGNPKLVGTYDPFKDNITFTVNIPKNIPSDTFEIIHKLHPLWLGGCIVTAQCALLCLITVNLVLLIWWREDRQIKAISPVLSVPVMIGCYLLCVALIILAAKGMTVVESTSLLVFLCNLKVWLTSVGIDLIFSTLLLRLLRVFHLFRSFHKTSKYWSDKYLIMYIVLLCLGKLILLVLWISIDYLHPITNKLYVSSTSTPHYRAIVYCTSNYKDMWTLVSFLYSGILILFVMFFCHSNSPHQKGQL